MSSNNKLVQTIIDAATLTGLAAGIGWAAKKVVKENFTQDPSSNVMNYVKFTAVMAAASRRKSTSKTRRFFLIEKMILELYGQYCDYDWWRCSQCRGFHWWQLSREIHCGRQWQGRVGRENAA